MQTDLVPELPQSRGYEKIVTAIDVLSRYLFAYATSNQYVKKIAKVIMNIKTKHAFSSEFPWSDPSFIEKVVPSNNYRVREVGTNKMQVLHRMRMSQFTPRQPPLDILITPQEWKPVPDVSLRRDELYVRAWECQYEKLIFEAEINNSTPSSSPEIPLQSDLSTEETRNTPVSAQECSWESDVTDMYPYIETDVETSSEQPNNNPTNPRSSKDKLRHNPIPNCIDNYR